jgi:probable phosphoglycerate mutase
MLLYLVRHGDPIYVTDSLTERGILQAEAVGKRIAYSEITEIYSSTMGRAQMTAEPAARLLSLPINPEPWAREVEDERLTPYPDGRMKSVTTLPNTVLRANGNLDLPFDRALECTGLSEANMKPAIERIVNGGREFLARLGYVEENGIYRITAPNEGRIALFCHAVMQRVWISHLLHIPLHTFWASFAPTHTGVTVLEFKNYADGYTAPKCLCFSDMSHLYAEGLDNVHDNHMKI